MDLLKLKQIFPSISQQPSTLGEDVAIHHQGKVYFIPSNEVNEDQRELLDAINSEPIHTSKETKWLSYLNNYSKEVPHEIDLYRFVHIQMETSSINQELFRESVETMLGKNLLFLWNEVNHVCIFEEIHSEQDVVNFQEIIDLMSDDLDMKLRIFVTDIQTDIKRAPDLFHWSLSISREIWKGPSNRVVKQPEAMRHLMPHLFTKEDRLFFSEAILKDTLNDPELLRSIRVVIECQGNVSLAAKKLFMHRNSLQYRIEKFSELTGYDLRSFEDMFHVYLAFLITD
ncbi:PucR family transcriptional regulator [Halalkalibacillus sediminis]|nr:helix-turn-helix domain-containing protein [Halalkalibacillus sediminis]